MNHFQQRFRLAIKVVGTDAENPIHLFGPLNCIGNHIPIPAANTSDALSLCKACLALPQGHKRLFGLFLRQLALRNILNKTHKSRS